MPFRKSSEVVEKEHGDRLLLFQLSSGTMVELNEVAALLWKKTGESFTHDDLRKVVFSYCDGAVDVEDDLRSFVKSAIERQLIDNEKD